jgi:hypothetical protein
MISLLRDYLLRYKCNFLFSNGRTAFPFFDDIDKIIFLYYIEKRSLGRLMKLYQRHTYNNLLNELDGIYDLMIYHLCILE